MTRLVIFVALSAVFAYISKDSLGAPRAHGFYRFVAWECILGLIVLNFVSFRHWFGEPLAVRQIVSWFLLVGSLVPLVPAVYQLHTEGKPDAGRDDAPLLGMEKTTRLVTTGVFRFIRHPMYASLLLLAWGVFFKKPTVIGAGLGLAATAFLHVTARVEERENIDYFGEAYRTYMQTTRRFVPFLY